MRLFLNSIVFMLLTASSKNLIAAGVFNNIKVAISDTRYEDVGITYVPSQVVDTIYSYIDPGYDFSDIESAAIQGNEPSYLKQLSSDVAFKLEGLVSDMEKKLHSKQDWEQHGYKIVRAMSEAVINAWFIAEGAAMEAAKQSARELAKQSAKNSSKKIAWYKFTVHWKNAKKNKNLADLASKDAETKVLKASSDAKSHLCHVALKAACNFYSCELTSRFMGTKRWLLFSPVWTTVKDKVKKATMLALNELGPLNERDSEQLPKITYIIAEKETALYFLERSAAIFKRSYNSYRKEIDELPNIFQSRASWEKFKKTHFDSLSPSERLHLIPYLDQLDRIAAVIRNMET